MIQLTQYVLSAQSVFGMCSSISIILLVAIVFCIPSNGVYGRTDVPLKQGEKCPYKDTVDLTGLRPFDNGTYRYNDILIPPNKVSTYNYTLGFRNTVSEVDLHIRGCICGLPKNCVKLCCNIGEYFNEITYECEQLWTGIRMPTEMYVITETEKQKLVNIFEYFVPQFGKPCKHLESLTMEVDVWDLKEVGKCSEGKNK